MHWESLDCREYLGRSHGSICKEACAGRQAGRQAAAPKAGALLLSSTGRSSRRFTHYSFPRLQSPLGPKSCPAMSVSRADVGEAWLPRGHQGEALPCPVAEGKPGTQLALQSFSCTPGRPAWDPPLSSPQFIPDRSRGPALGQNTPQVPLITLWHWLPWFPP